MLNPNTLQALNEVYAATSIPFILASHLSQEIISFPPWYLDYLKPYNNGNFDEDTLSSSSNPDGVTLIEAGPECNCAVMKLDEEYFVLSGTMPSMSRAMPDLAILTANIRSEKMADYLAFYRELPVTGEFQLTAAMFLIKYIWTGKTYSGINHYRYHIEERFHIVENEQKEQENNIDFAVHDYSPSTGRACLKRIAEAILHADPERFRNSLQQLRVLRLGALSGDYLQHEKYIFTTMLYDLCTQLYEQDCEEAKLMAMYAHWCRQLDSVQSPAEVRTYLEECIRRLYAEFACEQSTRTCSYAVRKAISYIRSHLTSPLTAAITAEAIGCSRSALSTAFAKETGTTLHSYILDARLTYAAEQMKENGLKPQEAAVLLCFSSQSHFISCFRKKYGMTPGEYIRRK